MGTHDWTDFDGGEDDSVDVRHVQPYEAVKPYRCPGCDHEIRVGEGHEVVVPRDRPVDRRHWHSGCWHRAARQKGVARTHTRRARPRRG
jgi:hypothetical protein